MQFLNGGEIMVLSEFAHSYLKKVVGNKFSTRPLQMFQFNVQQLSTAFTVR